jgi:hypothetical protein
MTLFDAAKSWLINLPEGSIYTWDQLYAIFVRNLQGTYEHPSTAETLKTIRQKHDESLRDYVKHFCNVRNSIPYVQDIEVINAFHDGVNDIKTVEEITMKKSKMVDDLLTVSDTCWLACCSRITVTSRAADLLVSLSCVAVRGALVDSSSQVNSALASLEL